MIASSGPTASISRIKLDRVRKMSGLADGRRRRKKQISASCVGASRPYSSMSKTCTAGPSVSKAVINATRASDALPPAPTIAASAWRTRNSSCESAASSSLALAAPSLRRSKPTNDAPIIASANRIARRVFPLPRGPTMWVKRQTSRNSKRSPPHGHGRSMATLIGSPAWRSLVKADATDMVPRSSSSRSLCIL